jgi:CBS domain-containing protein
MLISDVLSGKSRDVHKIRPTAPVSAAVEMLADRRIGALVVEDQWMKIVGIFSERDFIRAIGSHGSAALSMTVGDLMSAPVITCRPQDRIDAVLATMTMRRIRHLPVMEGNTLVGIISIGDLVKHRLDEKELETNVLLEISRMRA